MRDVGNQNMIFRRGRAIDTIFKAIAISFIAASLQSCISNQIPERCIVKNDGECFMQFEGKLRPIKCPTNEQPVWSTGQRTDSVERFRDFLASPNHAFALKMSGRRDLNGIVIDHARLENYGDELKMMLGEKFIVVVYFRNYSLYPYSYYGDRLNKKDASDYIENNWRQDIFKYYLGEEYRVYEPKLLVVDDERVGMRLLVDSIERLEGVIYRDPIISIRHIGDPIYPLEEIVN